MIPMSSRWDKLSADEPRFVLCSALDRVDNILVVRNDNTKQLLT